MLQYSRTQCTLVMLCTHKYAAILSCTHEKRLTKVSIFAPISRLFPLIPAFHPCLKSGYSMGFSRTYARFIFYYKPKENLFSQIRTIGKSPLSRFSYAPAATSKGGGCTSPSISYSPYIRVFSVSPIFFIPFVIKQLYKQNTRSQRIFFSFITCTMLISLFRVSEMSEYLSIS